MGDDRGARVRRLLGHPGEPGAQQHDGEPAGPRRDTLYESGDSVDPRIELRGSAHLPADHRLAVHVRRRHRGQHRRRPVGQAVDRHRPGRRSAAGDQGHGAGARLQRAPGRRRRDDRGSGDDRPQPRPGRSCRPERALAPGRHNRGPGAVQRSAVRRPLRVRGAQMRDRRPQRRQRRDDPVPVRHAAHVLLRVLRDAAAVVGHDRDPQAGRGLRRRRDLRLHRQRLLQPGRRLQPVGQRGRSRLDRVRARRDARRRRAVDRGRGRAWRAGA